MADNKNTSAAVHIKTDEQKQHEARVLASYGVDPRTATKEQREYAQEISRQTAEIERRMSHDSY